MDCETFSQLPVEFAKAVKFVVPETPGAFFTDKVWGVDADKPAKVKLDGLTSQTAAA